MQKREAELSRTIAILLAYAMASVRIRDSFFADQLRTNITRYLKIVFLRGDKKDVAQYHRDTLHIVREGLGLLDAIEYLKFIDGTPLLALRQLLLQTYLSELKQKNNTAQKLERKENVTESPAQMLKICDMDLSDTKMKILDFIGDATPVRARDIVHQFKSISSRTIKRNIRELTNAKLLKKVIQDEVVHYKRIA
jgi:hypothetical protein